MGDSVKMFALTDEQLKTVTGGVFSLSTPDITSNDGTRTVNISNITQSNAILFRKISGSSIGVISVTQSHVVRQVSTTG